MEDSQLIAYLDGKFGDLRQEMSQRFEQVDRRFEQVDGRFEQVDGRFEQVDGRLEQVDRRLGGVEQRLDGLDGEVRGLHVLYEDLRDRIATVAEGVVGANEQLEAFRGEVREELREVRFMRQLTYSNLDLRLRKVEETLDVTQT